MSKKILVIVLVIIFAAIVFFSLTRKKQDQNTEQSNTQNNQQNESQNKTQLNFVDPEKLPEKFPADFPIEAGAEILQNYNNDSAESFQSTRRFVSKKNMQQNYDFYTKYLKDNAWEILASQNKTEVKSIFAMKGGTSVSATFSKNATGESVVDLSFNIKK